MTTTRSARPRGPAVALSATLLVSALPWGCGRPSSVPTEPVGTPATAAASPRRAVQPVASGHTPRRAPPGSAAAAASTPARPTPCDAPSLQIRGDRDLRGEPELADCRFRPPPEAALATRCGMGEIRKPLDLDRLDEAVLAFDEATAAHLHELAKQGQTLGRRRRVLALIGDSATHDPRFLAPFGEGRGDYTLSPAVRQRLGTAVDGDPKGSIIDYYRGVAAHQGRDSFGAWRAAKNGAHSHWAAPLALPRPSWPAQRLIAQLSPSVAVIMYGSNDATARFVPLDRMAREFEQHMTRIVDLLEQQGVIPVLSTLPRHLDDPDKPDCDLRAGDLSDWRWAVQNNRLSAAVAQLACRRHLPLIDLRHAMEGLVNHGIGADGSHPNGHQLGSAKLDDDGLQCGFNVRNYVTLRMLQQIKEHLEAGPRR